jgi:hypothetical protein
MDSQWLWIGVANLLATVVGLALQVGLLVVALTVVRRHKPEAVPLLAGSFAVGIASTVLSAVAYPLAAALVQPDGMRHYAMTQAALSVGFMLLHLVSGVLLILGLVKLATPTA